MGRPPAAMMPRAHTGAAAAGRSGRPGQTGRASRGSAPARPPSPDPHPGTPARGQRASAGDRTVAAAGCRRAFLHQGDRRQPQILEQPQVCVERLERGRRVITHVAHKLAHMGPVLLFNVRVVVFLVGPPPRELNLLPLAVAIEVMVDELRPVCPNRCPGAETGAPGALSRAPPCTRTSPLPSTARVSTQVVCMSVRFSEWMNSPSAQSPELRH